MRAHPLVSSSLFPIAHPKPHSPSGSPFPPHWRKCRNSQERSFNLQNTHDKLQPFVHGISSWKREWGGDGGGRRHGLIFLPGTLCFGSVHPFRQLAHRKSKRCLPSAPSSTAPQHSALQPVAKTDCLSRDTLGSSSMGQSLGAPREPDLLLSCPHVLAHPGGKNALLQGGAVSPAGGQNLSICRALYPSSTRCRTQPRPPSTIQHSGVPECPTADAALELCGRSCHSPTGNPRAPYQAGGPPYYTPGTHAPCAYHPFTHMHLSAHTPCAHTEYTRTECSRICVHTAGLHTHLRARSHTCTHCVHTRTRVAYTQMHSHRAAMHTCPACTRTAVHAHTRTIHVHTPRHLHTYIRTQTP